MPPVRGSGPNVLRWLPGPTPKPEASSRSAAAGGVAAAARVSSGANIGTAAAHSAMSNEIVVVAFVVAAIVAIYLLRHVIALAIRLIILAALVLAGYWAWQNRGELLDAAEPYLGGFGDRFRDLDAPALRNLLDDLDPSEAANRPRRSGRRIPPPGSDARPPQLRRQARPTP